MSKNAFLRGEVIKQELKVGEYSFFLISLRLCVLQWTYNQLLQIQICY